MHSDPVFLFPDSFLYYLSMFCKNEMYYFSYYPGKKDIKAVVVEGLVDMWPGLVLKDWDFLKRCCEH